MNYNEPSQPSLVEPGVKYFLRETLKNCHTYKEKYKNQIFNLSIFLGFVFIVGAILMYKYKGKPTTEEINQKDTEKKQYVLSKIRNFQDARKRSQQQLITSLPQWENEFETVNSQIGSLSKII